MTKRDHLSPTLVVDKNGKTTTVHRKPASAGTQKANIPAPAVVPAIKLTPLKLTAAQIRPVRYDNWVNERDFDDELFKITGSTEDQVGIHTFRFDVNDPDFYSVRSVAGKITSSMLLMHGIRSGGEATKFLTENNLGHLIEDNSSLMEKALRRKLPAYLFSEFSYARDLTGLDEENVLDAVAVHGIAGYREARVNTPPAESVAKGEITVSDLKTLGTKHMGKSRPVKSLIEALKTIKAGTANYDAAGLRRLLDFIDTDDREKFDEPEKAIQLAQALGVDAVIELRSKHATHRTLSRLDGRIAEEEVSAFLRYADKGDLTVSGRGMKGDRIEAALALYRAGIDPVMAGERLRDGVDAEVIIGAQLNVHASVVGGWL